jgi:zinc/manganese transport system substrate-binding protein
MQPTRSRTAIAVLAGLSLVIAACGSDTTDSSESSDPVAIEAPTPSSGDDATATTSATAATVEAVPAEEAPTIVVTTNILGDVVSEVVGDAANVVTVMPVGADPHDFQASAQEVDTMMNADALIVNGEAFEEGLLDVIDSASSAGVPTFEAISAVDTIEFGEGGHDHADEDHADEDHADEDHADETKDDDHDHDHSGADPHFFTDPMRMAAAVEGIVEFLQSEVAFADPAALDASADAYIDELIAVDAEVEGLVGLIPEDGRVMVTNHEVFGYFADRYGFEVVGVVIPGGGTTDSVSAGELAELAEVIESEGVPAIFADTSSSDQLVQTLAAEVGDIEVVPLFTESLGAADSEGATYLDMVRTNGQRISDALA